MGRNLVPNTLTADGEGTLPELNQIVQLKLNFNCDCNYQEQLRHKQKLNIVAFDSLVRVWQPRVVQVSEASLQSAWTWVNELTCHGTTNTLEALQRALKDTETKAVYLLTDGRPDHVRTVSLFYFICLFSVSKMQHYNVYTLPHSWFNTSTGVAEWGGGMSAGCTVGPSVHWRGQCMAA